MNIQNGFATFHGNTQLVADSMENLRDLFDSRAVSEFAFDPSLAWKLTTNKGHVIHDMPQRSPEWFQIRRGIITASEVGMFLLPDKKDKKSLDARQNLIDKKLGELADGDDTEPSYENYWMKRGTLLEPESIEAYESHTGDLVYHVGFIQHDTLPIGCSPDGMIVGKQRGIEGKAVAGKTQIGRLRDNVLPGEYLCQIHHSMIVTGFPEWDFWSFHPGLPKFLKPVKRDGFTDDLEAGITALCFELARQKAWIRELWNDEMKEAVA